MTKADKQKVYNPTMTRQAITPGNYFPDPKDPHMRTMIEEQRQGTKWCGLLPWLWQLFSGWIG